jgi:hypothetical protein
MLKAKWMAVGAASLLLASVLAVVAMSRSASGDAPTALESCRTSLEDEGKLRKGLLARKDEEIARLKKQMDDREAFWEKVMEEKEAEKAGAWCWENYVACETLLERADKDCTFNMRMAKLVVSEGGMKQLKNKLKANGLSPDDWCNASPDEIERLKDLSGLDGSTGVPIVNLSMTYPAPLSEAEQIKEEE